MLNNVKLVNYTRGEEIANGVSHGIGVFFGVGVLALCLARAFKVNSWLMVICAAIYGLSMVVLYSSSTVYHSFPNGSVKKILRIIDHSMIFLLIAGTATPFALITVYRFSPIRAWIILAVAWGGLLLGVSAALINFEKSKVLRMILYIGLGWVMLISVKPLLSNFPLRAFILIFLGGMIYISGTIFYGVGKKIRYMHTMFHIFVLAGSLVHFICLYKYVFSY